MPVFLKNSLILESKIRIILLKKKKNKAIQALPAERTLRTRTNGAARQWPRRARPWMWTARQSEDRPLSVRGQPQLEDSCLTNRARMRERNKGEPHKQQVQPTETPR